MRSSTGAQSVKIAVIGKGLIGSAAARHLSRQVDGVALIGPDEPEARAEHHDVFGSHYDEGRIYRVIDPDPVWGQLALRSIARYAEIEAASGVEFHEEAGFLAAASGQAPEQIEAYAHTGELLGTAVERLRPDELWVRFPYLDFRADAACFQPREAGHISPRRLVQAQTIAAERNGATIVREAVHALALRDGQIELTTASRRILRAEKVLIATGGFANLHAVLPRPLAIDPGGRVIVLVEAAGDRLERLRAMPSIVADGCAPLAHVYVLPPVLYPDGRWYVKIGSGQFPHPLRTLDEFGDWFRGAGPAEDRDALLATLLALLPDLVGGPAHTDTCVVTSTVGGYPYLDLIEGGRIGIAVGGNGAAAKSSDEIGRLAADLLLAGEWRSDEYRRDTFRAHFAD